MSVSKEVLRKRIAVAAGREKADTVIKNGTIIDVFNEELLQGDVAIADGVFVGIGQYEGHNEIDAAGKYISPAFIDGHVHIESSMVVPSEFARVLLPHGVTTVITDPHEIANVTGARGIEFMLAESEGLPFDVKVMLPSCVPATSFEHSGAVLEQSDLDPFLSHPRVLGLAEVMDYPAVMNGAEGMLDKLAATLALNKQIDGHAAGLDAKAINVYRTAQIKTDHECVNVQEAKERLQRGMYLMIRQGTAAKDLEALLPVVNERNARRCLFVTDDKHLDELIREGSIDHHVRMVIQRGIPAITAIQMASLNAAECFRLHDKGAIAPGYTADFLLLDDLEELIIGQVYKNGKLVAERGAVVEGIFPQPSAEAAKMGEALTNSVRIKPLTTEQLAIPVSSGKAHVIGVIPNKIVTEHLLMEVPTVQGAFVPSSERDLLKMAVIERHHLTGNVGLGIVKGLGLQKGAIASTVAHDSHNLIVAGTNDEDMLAAVEAIKQMQGGLVVVENGKVLASLPLPIAGLISNQKAEDVCRGLDDLEHALRQLEAPTSFQLFLTLSFLALPVIPSLKLTDQGLFDVNQFRHINVEEDAGNRHSLN
ncbi:adenine deaminase [Brevibacillus choshinensis]|uniref:Adenine deaminase n=1 Tax=Brevibacillus choshinensis TaxID=54911 RepID=A0ABX7FPZ6_BRECH|nr:adenine deaminase [Brevibacillus choshinensis]QRG68156.1 adenine deaminase [Brevibacillus choshinensis]